jgi:hypothetical protein
MSEEKRKRKKEKQERGKNQIKNYEKPNYIKSVSASVII